MDQFIAGIGAGALTTFILHPLDLVKIRFQVEESISKRRDSSSLSTSVKATPRRERLMLMLMMDRSHTLGYLRAIYQSNGIKGLYQGYLSNIVASTVSWGAYFFLYEKIKGYFSKSNESLSQLQAWQYFMASASAGLVTVLISNPLWLIRTRLCLQARDSPILYKGIIDAFRLILERDGFRGLYKGLIPGCAGVSHGGIQFLVYEELKQWKSRKGDSGNKFSTGEYLFMSSISKVVASVTTYPYQVVRARLQKLPVIEEPPSTHLRGVIQTVLRIYRLCSIEGMTGFYAGLVPNLLRILPGTCITFVTYENIIQLLKRQTMTMSSRDHS